MKNINKILRKIKEKKFINLTSKLIKESDFSHNNKIIFQRWLKEELVAIYLAKKNRKKIDFIIDSEGIIQRLFIYIYKKKNKKEIIQKYMKFCPTPHHLVVMRRKIFLKKKSINSEFEMNEKELFKNYDVIKKILKKNKKVKITYQNDKKKFILSYFNL